MEIPLKGKIWKTGSGSYVITIPKDYIKNGLLQEGDEIVLVIKERLSFVQESKETFKNDSAVTKDATEDENNKNDSFSFDSDENPP